MLDKTQKSDIIITLSSDSGFALRRGAPCFADLCKGSTTDSDSVCLGSNPSSAAKPAVNCLLTAGFLFLLFHAAVRTTVPSRLSAHRPAARPDFVSPAVLRRPRTSLGPRISRIFRPPALHAPSPYPLHGAAGRMQQPSAVSACQRNRTAKNALWFFPACLNGRPQDGKPFTPCGNKSFPFRRGGGRAPPRSRTGGRAGGADGAGYRIFPKPAGLPARGKPAGSSAKAAGQPAGRQED